MIRGRRLLTPGRKQKQQGIRPTAARAREAVFNIIGPAVRDAEVLDFFAGTGAMGLEALSRGARRALFIDNSAGAINLITRNIARCGFADRTTVLRRDLSRDFVSLREWIPPTGFTLVFVDPPYREGGGAVLLERLANADIVAANGMMVVEHAAGTHLPAAIGGLQLINQRCYGEAGFEFYRCQGA